MSLIQSITVTPKHITLMLGQWSFDARVQLCPSDCALDQVVWYSDNEEIAGVNQDNGFISANGVGTARIYAITTDGNALTDYLTVTVIPVPVEGICINEGDITLLNGTHCTLTAAVYPSNATNKEVEWYSEDERIAYVDPPSGVVFANKVGETTIYAISKQNGDVRGCCTVTVIENIPVTAILVTPDSATVKKGESFILETEVYPENATSQYVKWSSKDETIATVNPHSGLVIAQNVGTTEIYATAKDGSGAMGVCLVTVVDRILMQNISLSIDELVLDRGDCTELTASVYPENATNDAICWSSDCSDIASIDSNGFLTAKSAGTTTIRAKALDGSDVCACCTVTVKPTAKSPIEEKPQSKASASTSSNRVATAAGGQKLNITLMSLFGGLGLKLEAHYDSTRLTPTSLGYGWYHNYEKYISTENLKLEVYTDPTTFSQYDGNSNESSAAVQTFTCEKTHKQGYVLIVDDAQEYPYMIDCNADGMEFYNANGNIAKIVDHQGFETLISYSDNLITITDGVTGKKMYLEKDPCCKIRRIYDDAGREVTLTYDANDMLTEICDVNGKTTSYEYDEEGRVTSGTNALGFRYFENTYDEDGYLIAQKDAMSVQSTTEYIIENVDGKKRTTVITTNRNTKQSSRQYDANDLLIRYVNENGEATSYEYDNRGNVTRETDAKGKSIIRVYNAFNKPVSITDKNGNTTTFEYDAKGNVVKIRYPAIDGVVPEETFIYNNRNQLTQHTDVRGTVTVYTYDTNGMLISKKVGSHNAIVYSYDNGMLKTETDARGNTTTYWYNPIGQVMSITDAKGKTTRYEYDAMGNLLRTIDPHNKSVTYTYDDNYQKTSVTDQNDKKTEYAYNRNMKNDLITLPDGNTIHYEFDNEDRPRRIIDQKNGVTTLVYDNVGRLMEKHLPENVDMYYEYDPVGNLTKELSPTLALTEKTYDAVGNIVSVKDDEGNVTQYQYNALSKPTLVTNPANGETAYTYSPAGDLLSETDPLGNRRTYTYDAYGNRATETDARGNTTTYTYDDNNNLLTVKDALGRITTYTYDACNRCTSVKDALNNVIRYGYNSLGRRTTVTDARGNVFTTTYDPVGNVVKTIDAKGKTISETVYNSLNLPFTVTDARGKTTTYIYNALGKVEGVTDPMNRYTEYTYDALGRNTAVKDATNNISSATYDKAGNITSLAGPLGGATNYTYDEMGRLISQSTTSGGTVSYRYNALSKCKKLTNARGQVKEFHYDDGGNMEGHYIGDKIVAYTYDENGNIEEVAERVDANAMTTTVTRTFDPLNRVSSYTDTYGKTIRYEYDEVGNLSKLTYPDNTAVVYGYDKNRNLTSVTDWANRVTTYTYDENNRVVGVTKPDGSVTTTVYDDMQRVTSTVEKTAGGTVITGFEYIYDDLSRVVEEKVLANSTKMCYTYDDLGRVTKRTVKNLNDLLLSEESFTYDAAGNLTDAPDSCFGYDTNNRLVVFNGNSVSYDMDGNMLSNGSLSCSYDHDNKLISAGGHTYTYNAEGLRIRNLCSDADTTYTYNTNCKLSQLLCKTTNGVVTKYVYGKGLIGEEKQGGAFKTYHFDSRGSTVAITDISGNITDTLAYDTYGKCISHIGNSFVIFGYNGRDGVITDKNGLLYMRARYYSPDMRRFVNADIVSGEISDSTSLNRYAYVNGNPVSFVDPFGLWSFKSAWDSFTNWVSDTANDVKDWFVDTANQLLDVYKQKVDLEAELQQAQFEMTKDIGEVVVNNIEGSAGICTGIGFAKEINGIGIEAISRSDIIGVQLKDGSLRFGHPGKSALNITLPILGFAGATFGPQNNTYEDWDLDNREVEDTTYFDLNTSYGSALAFIIGYHWDISISWSGIAIDLIEYFNNEV